MIGELELIETDNLFHPLSTTGWRIWMNVNPKQKYTTDDIFKGVNVEQFIASSNNNKRASERNVHNLEKRVSKSIS